MKLWPEDIAHDRVALCEAGTDRTLTYGELEAVRSRGTQGQRELAFIWSDHGFDAARCYLETLAAGHVVFMGDASAGPERREALEKLYDPNLVWEREAGMLRRHDNEIALHPDLNLLLSTSGSTGAPKFVRLSRRVLRANADAIASYLGLHADERAPLNLPLGYAYGLSILHSHLTVGATLIATGTNVFERTFWEGMEACACTSLAGVPFTWRMLLRLRLERLSLAHVKTITQAGGALDAESKRRLLDWADAHGARFFVMYGQTEATARMSFVPPELLSSKITSIGQAIPKGELRLADPTQDISELIYEGPNVMMGYASSQKDLGSGDLLGGVLHTGDLGRRDEDGFFYIEGRASRFVKVYGHRIDLDWVEQSLRDVLGGEVAVVGAEDRVVAILEDGDLSGQTREAMAALNIHPRAAAVEVVDALPRASSGKLSRQPLEERFIDDEVAK